MRRSVPAARRAGRSRYASAVSQRFFEAVSRHERRHLYDGFDPDRAPRKRSAVVTMVHDEAVFLPIWLRYYGRFFAPDDLYVLDHETTDGSTDVGGFTRIPVRHQGVDHTWMRDTVQDLQHHLLDTGYDAVVVTDVDEIVGPDPAWGDLGDYLHRLDEPFVTSNGREVVHLADVEPPIDLTRPLLAQRSRWFGNGLYSKPAVATVPMRWVPGFHRPESGELNFDPDLYLVHLHRIDRDRCLERHRRRSRRRWADLDDELGWAQHNRLVDDAAFDRWFLHDSGSDDIPVRLEPIPDRFDALV